MGVIAKYKFNNTLEANLLPEFNSEFTSDLYTVTDEVNGEVTTRTIESDSLPTLMRFGAVESSVAAERSKSLLEIISLDISNCKHLYHYFRYCINLTTVNGLIVHSGIKNLDNAFGNCNSLEFVDTSNWDTSNVTNMSFMFNNCTNLTSLDVSNWDTSNVTDMHHMFYNCKNLTSLDVSNWKTSNVANMGYMFAGCAKLVALDTSNWITSNVTNISDMFSGCYDLTTLNVSNWDVSKVTQAYGVFYCCSSLVELNVSNWVTSNMLRMDGMFYQCSILTALDVSNWDTSKVTQMYGMFGECSSLRELNVSNWVTSNVIHMDNMFYNCQGLTVLNVNNWDTSNVTNMDNMFHSCTRLTSLDVSNWNTSNVTDMKDIFYNTNNLKYLKCNNINTLNILNTYLPTKSSTSQGTIICKSDITNLDTTALQSKYWNILDEPTLIAKYVFDKSIHNNCIPEFNTEFEGYFIEDEVVEGNNEVTRTIESCGMLPNLMRFGNSNGQVDFNRRMSLLKMLNICNGLNYCHDMFAQCSNLISVCDINTSDVISMYAMFYYCNKLTSLDLSNFDTSKVTDMQYIFFNCNNLTSLDVSNWDTSNVTNMRSTFDGCNKLTTLDVSNWNTSNVNNMYSMFQNCNKLTTLDVSNFNTSKATDTTNMFYNTPLLTAISVLYMDKSSLQKLVDAMPTNSNKTLWYKDVNIDGITHGDNITLKKYMEGNVEIVLNSPLLEGDTIEVKDGKLCHYHKMGMVVLDGSENWRLTVDEQYLTNTIHFQIQNTELTPIMKINSLLINNQFINRRIWTVDHEGAFCANNGNFGISVLRSKLSTADVNGFKQWLSENPITLVYELETPTYEDITNLQSAPTLKTYLECSMEIDTDLPIDTNVTYRTNLSSVYVMERELDELDNGTDLGDILEGEVNE